MSRMECSVTDGLQYDDVHDEVPELDALERELVLYEMDDDWVSHYSGDSGSAWNYMYENNQPEMDRLAVQVRKETLEAEKYEREQRIIDLDEALWDIATPALARKQAW